MDNVKLSPPWYEYVNKIKALFDADEDIIVSFNEAAVELILRVDNTDKFEALSHLLPAEKDFGGQKLKITMVPANDAAKDNRQYLKDLFKGNPNVTRIEDVTGPITNSMTFIEFERDVIQYYNDNVADLHGNRTTVLEEIAREVFTDRDGVFFCTDNEMCYC